MAMIKTYGFRENKIKSLKLQQDRPRLDSILKKTISRYTHFKAGTHEEDIKGVDVWAYAGEKTFGIDLKTMHFAENGILPLETWSIMPVKGKYSKIGWTLDDDKVTDIVLWYWPKDGSYILLPFKKLREWFKGQEKFITKTYTTRIQETKHGQKQWNSECVFVPAQVVFQALGLDESLYSGQIKI